MRRGSDPLEPQVRDAGSTAQAGAWFDSATLIIGPHFLFVELNHALLADEIRTGRLQYR